jgi:hypothetical protein
MARVAVSGRFSGGIRGYAAQVAFDMRLTWDWVKTGFIKMGINLAIKLGYIPDLLTETQAL